MRSAIAVLLLAGFIDLAVSSPIDCWEPASISVLPDNSVVVRGVVTEVTMPLDDCEARFSKPTCDAHWSWGKSEVNGAVTIRVSEALLGDVAPRIDVLYGPAGVPGSPWPGRPCEMLMLQPGDEVVAVLRVAGGQYASVDTIAPTYAPEFDAWFREVRTLIKARRRAKSG